jgi:transposase
MKTSTKDQSPKRKSIRRMQSLTIGMDLGDKNSRFCVIDADGNVMSEGGLATTRKAIGEKFAGLHHCRIAIEVGTHSPWVSRLLVELGHEVIVANPRQLRLITESSRKSDNVDAETLARLARVDPSLLRPIRHRSECAQMDLMVIRARAALVQARTSLVNTARGLVKAIGERLPKVDAEALDLGKASGLPDDLGGINDVLARQAGNVRARSGCTNPSRQPGIESRHASECRGLRCAAVRSSLPSAGTDPAFWLPWASSSTVAGPCYAWIPREGVSLLFAASTVLAIRVLMTVRGAPRCSDTESSER